MAVALFVQSLCPPPVQLHPGLCPLTLCSCFPTVHFLATRGPQHLFEYSPSPLTTPGYLDTYLALSPVPWAGPTCWGRRAMPVLCGGKWEWREDREGRWLGKGETGWVLNLCFPVLRLPGWPSEKGRRREVVTGPRLDTGLGRGLKLGEGLWNDSSEKWKEGFLKPCLSSVPLGYCNCFSKEFKSLKFGIAETVFPWQHHPLRIDPGACLSN